MNKIKTYGKKSLWLKLTTKKKGYINLSIADEILNARLRF